MTEKISASHILCSIESNTDAEALETISRIKKKLEDGEVFMELAREFSDCPSGARGGDLGEFNRGQMVEEFDEVAFELKKDERSIIIKKE